MRNNRKKKVVKKESERARVMKGGLINDLDPRNDKTKKAERQKRT